MFAFLYYVDLYGVYYCAALASSQNTFILMHDVGIRLHCYTLFCWFFVLFSNNDTCSFRNLIWDLGVLGRHEICCSFVRLRTHTHKKGMQTTNSRFVQAKGLKLLDWLKDLSN